MLAAGSANIPKGCLPVASGYDRNNDIFRAGIDYRF